MKHLLCALSAPGLAVPALSPQCLTGGSSGLVVAQRVHTCAGPGLGGRARIGAAREGFLGETLSKLRLWRGRGVGRRRRKGAGWEDWLVQRPGGGGSRAALVHRYPLLGISLISVWRGNQGSERGPRSLLRTPICKKQSTPGFRAPSLLHHPVPQCPLLGAPSPPSRLFPRSPTSSLGSSHPNLLVALANLGPASGPLHWLFRLPEMPLSVPGRLLPLFKAQLLPVLRKALWDPRWGWSSATPGKVPTPFLGSILHNVVHWFLDESCLFYY